MFLLSLFFGVSWSYDTTSNDEIRVAGYDYIFESFAYPSSSDIENFPGWKDTDSYYWKIVSDVAGSIHYGKGGAGWVGWGHPLVCKVKFEGNGSGVVGFRYKVEAEDMQMKFRVEKLDGSRVLESYYNSTNGYETAEHPLPCGTYRLKWYPKVFNYSSRHIWVDWVRFKKVIASHPSRQCSSLSASYSPEATSAMLSWNRGNGNYTVVFMDKNNTLTVPSNHTSHAEGRGEVVYVGTGSSVKVSGLNPGIYYYVRAYTFNGSSGDEHYNTSSSPSTSFRICSQVDVSARSVSASTAPPGRRNHTLYGIKLKATDCGATLNKVTVTTGGNYYVSDIDKFYLKYSTSSSPGSGTTIANRGTVSRGGSISFSSLSRTISDSTTGYLYVTADISSTAGGGRNIYIKSTPLSNIRLSGNTVTGSAPGQGGTQTFLSSQVDISTSTVSNTTALRNEENHLLYQLDLGVTNADAQLTNLSLTAGGTYKESDIAGFKLYYSQNGTLDASNLEPLAEKSFVSSGDKLTFSDLSQPLAKETTGHLFVTADIRSTAVNGNTIQLSTSNSNILFAKPDPVKSGTPAGGQEHTFYASPTVNVSSPQQVANGEVTQGTPGHPIYRIDLSVKDNQATLTGLIITPGGTFQPDDILNFKLLYSTDNVLDADDKMLGSAQTGISAKQPVAFSGFSQVIARDNTGYLFVTADIAPNAEGGKTVYIRQTPTENLIFGEDDVIISKEIIPSGGTQMFPLSPYISVAAGFYHTVALKNNGRVWTWGSNENGQLGTGDFEDSIIALQVPGLTDVNAVAAGDYFSVALKEDGTVWSWGRNDFGQLGDGTLENRNLPIQVTGLTDINAIAPGSQHCLALKEDGTVWAWGLNRYGQLGDGATADSVSPVRVSDLNDITQIVAGGGRSMALKADKTVWAWGQNDFGQIGDNSLINRLTPVKVFDLENVKKIAAGSYHSLALKEDGTVWAWGNNKRGQLGNTTGTPTDSKKPIEVSGLTNVESIAGGNRHSLAMKADQTIWAWGSNEFGQIGDNTSQDRHTPVQVSGITTATEVMAGGDYSLALVSGGNVWAWGDNRYSQLGDGTLDNQNEPVLGGVVPFIIIASEVEVDEDTGEPVEIIADPGEAHQELYRLKLWVQEADATLTGLTLGTGGDYEATDLGTEGFELWYSADDILDVENDVRLATHPAAAPGEDIVFEGFSQSLDKKESIDEVTGYLMVTAAISENAVGGREIHILNTPLNQFVFGEKNTQRAGDDPALSGNMQRFPVFEVNIESADVPGMNIVQNMVKVPLHIMRLESVKSHGDLTGLLLTTAGTYQETDIVPNSIRLYYSESGQITGTSLLLKTHRVVSSGEKIAFTGFTAQPIPENETRYLIVTADISPTAGGERTISLTETSFTDITFSEIYTGKTGTDPVAPGKSLTFPMAEITVSAPQISPALVDQGMSDHILYRLNLSATGADAMLDTLTATLSGTYQLSDIDQFKLFYCAENRSVLNYPDDSAVSLLQTHKSVEPAQIRFTDLSLMIPKDAAGYLFIAADIAEDAIARTIQIAGIEIGSIEFEDDVRYTGQSDWSGPEGGLQTFQTPTVAISDDPALPSGEAEQGDRNHPLHRLKLTVSDADVRLTDLYATTVGNYETSDIENFNLIYSEDETLDDQDIRLAEHESLPSGDRLSFSGFSHRISKGTAGYLFIAADIGNANCAREIGIRGISSNDILFAENNLVEKTGAAPVGGNKHLLPTPTITVAAHEVPASTVEQDTHNHVLYRVQLDVTRADTTLGGLTLTPTGDYDTDIDLVPDSFRLYISQDESLSADDENLWDGKPIVQPNSNLVFSGLDRVIPKETSVYLILTVDVAKANGGRTIAIAETPLDRIQFACGEKTGANPAVAGGVQTFPVPSVKIAADPVPSVKMAAQNVQDVILYHTALEVTRAEAMLTGLTVAVSGTYNTTDLVPDSMKLRYSTDAVLTPGDETLETVEPVLSGGQLLFKGFSRVIEKNTTGYLFVTMDVGDAVPLRTIRLDAFNAGQLQFRYNATRTGLDPLPAGGTLIFPEAIVNLTSAPIPDAEPEQGTADYVLYHINMEATRADARLLSVAFPAAGTFMNSDIGSGCPETVDHCTPEAVKAIPPFKLRFSTDDIMDGSDQVIGSHLSADHGTDIKFENISQVIQQDTTRHLFLTADISGAAKPDRTIHVAPMPFENITFEYAAGDGIDPLPKGGVQTFPRVRENALDFEGGDDSVTILHSPDLNSTSFSVSARTKVEGGDGSRRSIAGSINADGFQGYELYADEDDKWKFRIGNGNEWIVLQGPEIQTHSWYNITGTYDENEKSAYLYVNGEMFKPPVSDPVSEIAYVANDTTPLLFGKLPDDSSCYDGQISNARIWNIALTQEQVQDYIDSPPRSEETGIVADYTFQTWDILSDATGHGHDGTISGDPKWALALGGLWVAQVEITHVAELGQTGDQAPTPTSSPFDMRILLHIDGDGNVNLLRNVTVMQKLYETQDAEGNTVERVRRVLITDDALLHNYEGIVRRDGKLVGVRLGGLAFDFGDLSDPDKTTSTRLAIEGTIGAGLKVIGNNILMGPDHPNNPFRHKYHPDHKAGRQISRSFVMAFDEDQGGDPNDGVYSLKGSYSETIRGIFKLPLRGSGQFTMEKVSSIYTLNDEL